VLRVQFDFATQSLLSQKRFASQPSHV
jgi:hypothetical protein